MKRSNPLSMLLPGNHGYFLRDFAYDIGCTASIILMELLELDDFFSENYTSHPKHGDGWFYATEDKIERRTGIRRKQQESDIRTLKNMGFIEMKVFGLPAYRYFRINKLKVMEYFGIQNNFLECTKSHSSMEDLKKRPNPRKDYEENPSKKHSRMDNYTNCDGQLSILGPYIYKEPKEEPERINRTPEGAKKTNSQTSFEEKPKEKPETFKPLPNIEVTQAQHEKLLKKYDPLLVQAAYEYLSEWKECADPKTVAKHKSDYFRITNWAIQALIEKNDREERSKQSNIAPHRRNSKLVTPGDGEFDGKGFKKL